MTDPRFSDPAKLAQNRPALTAILGELFGSKPMAHWHEVFSCVHVTFGAVRGPEEVINDPQLRVNHIVIPLEGATSGDQAFVRVRRDDLVSSAMGLRNGGPIQVFRANGLAGFQ